MEKDFNIKVTVRNGRLLSAIRENYESVAAFSRALGRSAQTVNSLVTMKEKPYKTKGWTDLALDIAAFVNRDPEDLWPEYMREVNLARATAEMSADLKEVQALQSSPSPEKQIAQLDALKQIASVLTPREVNVIKCRYADEMTLAEAAAELGVSSERMRQIEVKALRKMRGSAYRNGFVKKQPKTVTHLRRDGTTFEGVWGYEYPMTDHAKALFQDDE